ncbi:MAG: 23S rRNA (uracil(1939)-C(5))-methyltransferase RlmD [Elusimicrobia bacterium]|nr:23S rRNA (uracil(1939)-C(5))-methyltransferase RlmD [Elusimicrobiota bacterium]
MPRCRHFGSCGGCSLQDRSYESQLAAKAKAVGELLAPFRLERLPAHASPKPWFYRNKMEFSFGDVYPPIPEGPRLRLGLKARGRWHQVLSIEECYLLSPEAAVLLTELRRWAAAGGYEPYNAHRHRGFLRHLVLREAKNRPERMVMLLTSQGPLDELSLISAINSVYPATTVLRGINEKLSDTAIPDRIERLSGSGRITESIKIGSREILFQISPLSFFQTNTWGAELLYGIVLSWLEEKRARTALDLYCGGGGIALSIAGSCDKVWGVELNESAVLDARANSALNGISNVEFFAGSVELMAAPLLGADPDVVIVDPPRSGLQGKALAMILDKRPRALLYVSCNPQSLARDLKALEPAYCLERAEIIDMFPHTEHVETIAWLDRKEL